MRHGVAGVLALALARAAAAAPVAFSELPDHVTEAVVTVDAPPREVYRVVTDYERWPLVLHDVSAARIERGGRDDARVRFRSKVFGHDVTVAFENVPDCMLVYHVVAGPPGGRAWGSFALQPIDGGAHTRIIWHLHVHIAGLSGWLVPDSRLRSLRQDKLEGDLDDLAAYFATRHS